MNWWEKEEEEESFEGIKQMVHVKISWNASKVQVLQSCGFNERHSFTLAPRGPSRCRRRRPPCHHRQAQKNQRGFSPLSVRAAWAPADKITSITQPSAALGRVKLFGQRKKKKKEFETFQPRIYERSPVVDLVPMGGMKGIIDSLSPFSSVGRSVGHCAVDVARHHRWSSCRVMAWHGMASHTDGRTAVESIVTGWEMAAYQ